jgi:hypothetical protein
MEEREQRDRPLGTADGSATKGDDDHRRDDDPERIQDGGEECGDNRNERRKKDDPDEEDDERLARPQASHSLVIVNRISVTV